MPNVQYILGLVVAVVVTLCVTLLLVQADNSAIRTLCAVGLVHAGLVGAVMAVRHVVQAAAANAIVQVSEPLGARIGRVETGVARMADTEKQVLTVLTSDPVPPSPADGDRVRFLN